MFNSFEEALEAKNKVGGKDHNGWDIFVVPYLQEDLNSYFKKFDNRKVIPKDEEAKKFSSDGRFGFYSRNINI